MSPVKKSSAKARTAAEIRRRLLAWYDVHRRDLPWRQTDNPYRVWVAEVMLVQTQVGTVVPYYLRFLEHFPDVRALAAAELDDVLKIWEGLGYYARARNLHKAAKIVARDHEGRLPGDEESLKRLPGIGQYMASALLSISFGQRTLAVDGNVRRVLSRVYDISEPTPLVVREMGEPLVSERPGDMNQAFMDLGATICTPRAPECPSCPLETACLARRRDTVALRPKRQPARTRPHYDIAVGVIWRADEVLIAKRPPEGLLGGLWEFPGGKREPGETLEVTLAREVNEELGIEIDPGEKIAAIDHAYSHFQITLHAYHCRYRSGRPKPLGCQEYAWVRLGDLDRYAFPAANRKLLEQIAAPKP